LVSSSFCFSPSQFHCVSLESHRNSFYLAFFSFLGLHLPPPPFSGRLSRSYPARPMGPRGGVVFFGRISIHFFFWSSLKSSVYPHVLCAFSKERPTASDLLVRFSFTLSLLTLPHPAPLSKYAALDHGTFLPSPSVSLFCAFTGPCFFSAMPTCSLLAVPLPQSCSCFQSVKKIFFSMVFEGPLYQPLFQQMAPSPFRTLPPPNPSPFPFPIHIVFSFLVFPR